MSRIAPRTVRFGALSAALLFLPAALGAQAAPMGVTSQQRLHALFAGMSPRQDIQIVTPTFFIEEAQFESVGERFVQVAQAGETVPVSLDEIRAVSVRSGHGLQGALWGGASGLLVGSVGGMLVSAFYCTNPTECSRNEGRGAMRGAIALGIAGAVTGYLFGSNDRYWRPIFP